MNVEQFKKDYPEYATLEGNDLWDTMTNVMLRHQEADSIVKSIQPFFKRYQLRWLFYRKFNNIIFGKNDYSASEMCSICKKGVSSYAAMMFGGKIIAYCPHGRHELIKVANNTIRHKLWLIWRKTSQIIEVVLNWLHIVRKRNETRYGIFGDESRYTHQIINTETWETQTVHHPRKWWEYIFIKR